MPTHQPFLAIAALAAGISIAMPGGTAEAAPQVLGLVASNGIATPLTCDAIECSAHFSAFCLQQAEEAPASGTAYTPVAGGRVMLVTKTVDGRRLELPGEQYLAFNSLIGFTSVRISLPRKALAALNATEPAVEIGPAVSLIPTVLAQSRDPVVEEEIAVATGPMRAAASRMFEAPGMASDAARITSLLINALPHDPRDDGMPADSLWRMAAAQPTAAAATPDGLAMARQLYETCRLAVRSGSAFTMRGCLELRHADLMAATNHRFWSSVGGS